MSRRPARLTSLGAPVTVADLAPLDAEFARRFGVERGAALSQAFRDTLRVVAQTRRREDRRTA